VIGSSRARLVVALAALSYVGCGHPDKHYESVCQLVAREVVEVDDKGAALQVDLLLEWDPCPGDQFQVVRGGAEFATCLEKYDLGDLVPVRVRQTWDTRGFYTWDVYQVGDCGLVLEEGAEGSYERSQECSESKTYGFVNGFHCNRKPFEKLVRVCPWMARN
jgi:hypothetical protein